MAMRRSKSAKQLRRRVSTVVSKASADRAAVPLRPAGRADHTCEVGLVALALGLLALIAGASFVPVLLLVALALGVWAPRS